MQILPKEINARDVDIPNCHICRMRMVVDDKVVIAHNNHKVCLVHEKCVKAVR